MTSGAGAGPELVTGFGLYNYSVSPVYRPSTGDELAEVVRLLHGRGESPVFRGAGRSYGDAATNPQGPVVDLTGLNRVLSLDGASGLLTAEAGVSWEGLWRHSVPLGWWPPIVPGTMYPTLGGAISMNIHGKNGWRAGTLGEHVGHVVVLENDGSRSRYARGEPGFFDVVSVWGAERPIVEASLEMKKLDTGFVDVLSVPTGTLAEQMALLDAEKDAWEYLVGWIDAFPAGDARGRGVVHLANPVHEALPEGKRGLTTAEQEVRSLLPPALLLAGLKLWLFDSGMRLVNLGKYLSHRAQGRTRYRQSLVAFSFLFDVLPGFRDIYRPGGFIQYQLFVPKEAALEAFTKALALQHELHVPSYLGVIKRHRADRLPFRNRYTSDGYSLALDFPVTPSNSASLARLCREYDALLRDVGGSNYKAKDCVGSLPRRSPGVPRPGARAA
ncbi:MAG: FAD-binding oxidoreductase [Acidobacteria bacterium]|nr:FAD-binding oxidoreductase [Acidobacteriota bacterium]